MGIQLYQRVAFARDVPEYNLIKGDVAEVTERLTAKKNSEDEEGYMLEVFNAVGEILDVVIVPASAIKPLTEEEILHVRPLYTTPPSKSEVTAS